MARPYIYRTSRHPREAGDFPDGVSQEEIPGFAGMTTRENRFAGRKSNKPRLRFRFVLLRDILLD